MFAVAVTLTMALIGTSACSRKGDPTDRKVMEAAGDGESVSRRELAETALKCPDGTKVSGGDGSLRSSYGCARPDDPPGKFHGPYGQWFRNNKRAVAGQFDDTKQTGTWTTWRADGSLLLTVEFHEGVRHGTSVSFSEDGSVVESVEYYRGNPVGEAATEAPRTERCFMCCGDSAYF